MGFWLVVGVLLAGCGVGALLTAVVYLTQLRKVKTELHKATRVDSRHRSQTPSDGEKVEDQGRSA
jgi:hypothetical protein